MLSSFASAFAPSRLRGFRAAKSVTRPYGADTDPRVHPHPPFSWIIFLSLVAMILASSCIFYFLTRRWTQDRPRAAVEDWAREHEYTLRFAPRAQLPAALLALQPMGAQVIASLKSGSTMLLHLTTPPRPSAKQPHWHLLIRQVDLAWEPAGLRPVGQSESILDLFKLSDFPSLLPPDRFVVHAMEPKMAKTIAASPARGLLPPNVGLMLHGPYVTIDFARPFDSIEFERMLAVMEQVVPTLPAGPRRELCFVKSLIRDTGLVPVLKISNENNSNMDKNRQFASHTGWKPVSQMKL